ncbi:MocR-like pyridoxine biosynthesis transcription factor PdxR [Kitasatospora sp. NPDC001175]|uniref:MocR-like pyridoxine biosynthesis transcription factor PdxR n=1 Tax=Kitasatospora sp. NPDC001175 TaxID=3157103 RepID=UPI003D02ADAA
MHVTLGGRGDRAARIYRQLLDAVLDGRLRPGERLPPSRELARRLGVSRNTVASAYERLAAEGFLQGRAGSGTFVSGQSVGTLAARRAPAGPGAQPRRVWQSVPAARGQSPEPTYDFRVGTPDGRLFPFRTWRRLITDELRPSGLGRADYGPPEGHADLRAAIARHVGLSRSVRATAEDVLVTQGAQQALDLVGRVVIEPGDCVAVEDPGYPPARLLFGSLGARVVGVPVDTEGLMVDALPREARLVYTTPSHQFPLGTPMSLARRAALLDWAERHDAVVVEDDYDSEFRFTGRPLEPLQSLDPGGRVVYVGSYSKTLLPALRLGFLVAPASLQAALHSAKQLSDWHGDPVAQAALARFIDEGLLARHIRRAGREYAARHALLTTTLARDFAPWLEPVPSAAGLHVCARTAPGVDLGPVLASARRAGVAVNTVADFSAGEPTRPGLVFGFGAIDRDRIAEGLQRLRQGLPAAAPPIPH